MSSSKEKKNVTRRQLYEFKKIDLITTINMTVVRKVLLKLLFIAFVFVHVLYTSTDIADGLCCFRIKYTELITMISHGAAYASVIVRWKQDSNTCACVWWKVSPLSLSCNCSTANQGEMVLKRNREAATCPKAISETHLLHWHISSVRRREKWEHEIQVLRGKGCK